MQERMVGTRRFVVLLLGCLALSVAWSRVIHVDAVAGLGGDGASWAMALNSLQEALARARAGDQVWVAQGSYWPEQPISTDPELLPAATFHLSPGVFLYGGFAGYEADPEERNRIDVNDDGVVDPWEFMTPTVLSAHPDYPGTVLAVRNTSDGELTVADGVCLRGGRTTGAGGGASLGGNTVMRNCRIENNVAASGGGAHLYDGARGYRCLFSGNALYDPESGVGGGLLLESEAVLRESLVCANRHGGVALRLNSEAAFCTVAGNQSTLYGSGVRGDGGRLDSCVIWGNTGSVCQLWGEVALSNSAVQGGYGGDTIPLQGENHGSSGCAGNDNRPECCYPCFRNPEAGDYHLNAGSYLLRRGADDSVSGFPADIGCFQAGLPGNLCGGVGMTLPLMYARPVALNLRVGPRTPAGVVMHLLEAGQPLAMGSMRSGWQWCPAAAGASDLRLVLELPEQNAVWNSAEVSIRREVAPRLLRVAADDLIWPWNAELPELTWRVVAGSLVEPDRLIGALAVVDNSALSPAFEIGPGSLTVMDGNYGLNYDLQFQPGTLLRTNGEATLSLAGLQSEYTASPVPVRVETLPVGLNLRVTYEGINGTDYPLSLQAPVHVGEYQVNVTVDDPIFYGDAAGILTINKAVLFCQPADAQRASGASNPDFLLIYNGFCGDDGVGVLTPPQIVCYADRQSPEGDYMLALTGGQARDYRMEFVPGVLRIRRTVPRLNEALIMAGMYGQKLGQLEIMAYAVDPRDDRFVPGVLLWEQAGLRLPAGCWAEPWHFVPDDLFTYATVTGSGTVCLQPRPLQAAADLRQKVYGEADPPLSVRVTAGTLISGDLFSGALQREPGEAAGAYAITAGTLTLGGNYLLEIIPAMLTILPRPVEVMVLSQRKASGRPDPTLQWSVGHGSLAGWDAWNGAPERLPGETVGEYPYTRGSLQITGPHGGGNNYRFSLVVGELTVFDGTLQFVDGTMPLMEVVYGTPLSSALVTAQPVLVATGNVMPGTVIWEREGEVFGAGEWELRWEFRPDDPVSCSPFGGIQTVQVQKATLQVSLCGSPVSWVYATPLPELRLDITGFANADDQSCLDELPVALAPIDPALRPGDYPVAIQAGVAANYEFAAQPGVLCVLPDGLQADGITATSLVYGDCLGEARLEGEVRAVSSGLPVAGTLAWQEPESHPDTGTTITAWRFVPVMIGCYEELQGMVAVQTMPRPITVQALSSDKIYGEADPVWEYAVTAGTLLPGDAFSGVLQREAGAICGTYLITSGTLQLNHHYELQFEPALLTIQPRAITIRIQDVTRPYGEANPLWAWEVSAGRLVGDDQPTGEPVVVDGDRPGQVPIAVGTLNFGLNYQATIIPGVLTIVPASVQADAVTTGNGVHGQPLGAVVLNGIFCTQSGVAVPGVLSWQDPTRELTEGTSLEEWIFRPTDAEAYTEVRGIAHVFCGTARLQVSANAQIMEYGSEMPELTWTISAGGLRPGEEITGTLARGESQDDGHTFAIVRGSLTPPPGYELEVIPGVLTVQPRPLTVNAVALTMLYGEETPVLRYEISQGSLVPGDAFSGVLQREAGAICGTYLITSGTLQLNHHYELQFEPALLTIQPRAITIRIQDVTRPYGEANPLWAWEVSAGRLVGDDQPTGEPVVVDGDRPGQVPIAVGTLNFGLNYQATIIPGVLTIVPASVQADAVTTGNGVHGQPLGAVVLNGIFCTQSGVAVPGVLSWQDPTRELTEGTSVEEWIFRPTDAEAYTEVRGIAHVFCGTARLQVSANAQIMEYGSEMPELTWTISAGGLRPGEEITGTLARGESQDDGHTFAIVRGSLTPPPGYELEVIPGVLTVQPRPLTVNAMALTMLYGEETPVLRYEISQGSLVPGDAFSGVLQREAGAICGTYLITSGTLQLNHHYELQFEPALLTIQPRAITIRIQDVTRPYGEANPLWAWEVSAGRLVGDDQPTGEPVVVDGDRPGQVPIAVGTLNFGLNYQATIIPGVLTIVRASVQADAVTTGNGVHGQPLGAVALNGIFCTQSGVVVPGVLSWQDPTRELTEGTSVEEWIFRPTDAEAYTEVRGIAQVFCGTARLQVSANAQIMEYGSEMPELTWTISAGGLRPGEEITGTLARGESQDDGHTFAIVRGSLTPPPGYELEVIPGVLTVQPRPLTVNAVALTMLYGEETPVLRYEISQGSLVPGDAFSGVLQREAGAICGTYLITSGTFQLNHHYELQFEPALLTIQPRAITIRIQDVTRPYGEANPLWAWEVSAGRLVGDDQPTGEPVVVDGDRPGQVPIAVGTLNFGLNYQATIIPGVLTIVPASVQADAVTTGNGVHGQPLGAVALNGTFCTQSGVAVPGVLSWQDPTRELTEGTSVEEWIFRPTDAEAYTEVRGIAQVFCGTARLQVSVNAQIMEYGSEMPELTWTISAGGLRPGEEITGTLARGESQDDGHTFAIVRGSLTPPPGYELEVIPGVLTVQPRPLTVNAVALTMLYGEETPVLRYEISQGSLVPGDAFSGELSCPHGGEVGTYSIESGTLALGPFYQMEYVGALLQVQSRPVRVQADGAQKIYGQNDPALTYRISAGTLVPGDAFSGSLQRELGEAAGDYPIQQGTLRLNDNYRLEYVPGVYRILPQPLTVIADNQQKLQGEDDPEWTWVFGATGNLSGQSLTGALSRDPGEGAGEYLIRPGNLAVPANYTLDFVPGRLTILPPAHVIHDLQATTLTYGEPLSASSLSAEIIFSDGQIHCEGNFAWGEPELLPESGSASHPWQFTFFNNAWEPLQGNAMVTVLPRLLPVQGENVEKLVGEPEPPFTYSYDSALLVRAQDTASGSLGRQPGEIPGMYAYILGDLSFGPNYRIVLQGGSLSICLPQIAVDDDWSGKTNGEVVTYDGYQFIYGYNAYATLQEALPLAASGGEIILLPGRYLPVDDGWTLSRPVRLHGQRLDLEGPILQGTLAVCGNRASGSEISGVSLLPENGCLPGPALSLSEARQVILRDCIVANFAYGVQLGGSAQASMIDSLLECQRCCIQIGTPEAPAAGHGLTLSGNLLRSTADKDDAYLHIALYDAAVNGSGRLLLWNNTVADVSLYAPPAEEVAVQLRTDIGDRERPGWPDAGVVVLDKPSAVLQLDQTVWALGTSVLSGLLCDETGQGLAGLSFDVCWLDGENEILRQTVHSDANGEIMLPVGALYVGCYQVHCEMSENLDYYLEPTTRTCVVEEVMPTGLLLRTTVLPAHVASGSQLTVEVIGTFAEWSWEVTNLASLRVTHEAGGSFTGNAYLADKVGGWLMTAEYAGLTAELPFSVTAGPFHHYCVSWDQPVLYAGQIGTFSRVRHDVGHNPNPTGQIPDAVFNSTPYGSGIVSNNVIFANYKSAGTSLNLSWTCMQYQPGTLSSVVVPLDVPLLPWHAYVDSDKYPYTFLYHRATSRLVGITSGIWYAIDNSSVEVCFNLEKNSQDPKSFVITVTGCRIAGVEYPLGVNRLAAFVLTSMSRRYEVRGERTDVTFVPQNPAWPALFSYLRNGVIEFGFLEKYNQ